MLVEETKRSEDIVDCGNLHQYFLLLSDKPGSSSHHLEGIWQRKHTPVDNPHGGGI
jgi:hypothetical protein